MPDRIGHHGQVAVIRGDARALPLPDASVDLIVTSPPYWALRSYQDTCSICRALIADGHDPREVMTDPPYDEHVRLRHHYAGQIGAEPTPAAYVEALIGCTREWMRVLKPTGSLFVNLGDAYNSTSRQAHRAAPAGPNAQSGNTKTGIQRHTYTPILKVKSLLGLPERYMLRCIDDLGLILRAKIVWSKPNGLPESVTDRVRRSHEDWFHFTLQPRYYAAVDEIRGDIHRGASWSQRKARGEPGRNRGGGPNQVITSVPSLASNPLGALPGSVWTIATQPLTVPPELGVDHYAAFPLALPRRIIAAWSPPDGLIVDPFGGTGTTALAARALGRNAITVDMSADYCRLATWRTTDPGELARALGVAKPAPVPQQQLGLFEQEADHA